MGGCSCDLCDNSFHRVTGLYSVIIVSKFVYIICEMGYIFTACVFALSHVFRHGSSVVVVI